MKKVFIIFFFITCLLMIRHNAFAGNIGDPGPSGKNGDRTVGTELSIISREIRDGEGIRYDTEGWRLFLKSSYGITDWLEVFGRLGGAAVKIRGTSFDSNPGIAAGGGLKGTFLDPPNHPLRYSLGGQFLYMQAKDEGAEDKWLEYDLWLGMAYKEMGEFVPFGGIIYSRIDGKMKNFPSQPMLDEFKSPTTAGFFLGFDWSFSKGKILGMEFRGISENSGMVSFGVRF